eukprot:COSAG04_NODE_217_length_19889_cov_59.963221_2_plen_221_part_00
MLQIPTWQRRAAHGGLYSRQADGAPRRRVALQPARGARRSAARRGRCSRPGRRISAPTRVTGGGGRRGGQSARPESVSTPRYEPRALGAWARFCTARRRPRFCAAGCGISDVALCAGLRMKPPGPTDAARLLRRALRVEARRRSGALAHDALGGALRHKMIDHEVGPNPQYPILQTVVIERVACPSLAGVAVGEQVHQPGVIGDVQPAFRFQQALTCIEH